MRAKYKIGAATSQGAKFSLHAHSTIALSDGRAAPIFTGAALPAGADAVIQQISCTRNIPNHITLQPHLSSNKPDGMPHTLLGSQRAN